MAKDELIKVFSNQEFLRDKPSEIQRNSGTITFIYSDGTGVKIRLINGFIGKQEAEGLLEFLNLYLEKPNYESK